MRTRWTRLVTGLSVRVVSVMMMVVSMIVVMMTMIMTLMVMNHTLGTQVALAMAMHVPVGCQTDQRRPGHQ